MSEARLLVIDTCGQGGSVAIASDELLLQEELAPRMAASHGLGAVRRLLEQAGWALGELSAIAVVHGPGSFTGVRVGVAMAKGLAEAAGLGLIPVSRLEVLRASFEEKQIPPLRSGMTNKEDEKQVLRDAQDDRQKLPSCGFAAMDAGRGEFYLGSAEAQELVTLGEMLEKVPAGARVAVCEERVADVLDAFALVRVAEPQAKDAVRLAMDALKAGRVFGADEVDALYLRRPDAERALGRASHV